MKELDKSHDALTEIWNRQTGLVALEKAVEEKRNVGLILCDVDHTKRFNDQFGHAKGDEKLIEIARSIQLCAGADTVTCRFGGDAFLVVCPDLSLAETKQRAEAIHDHQQPISLGEEGKEKFLSLTFSIGVAHFPTHVENAEALLWAADLALLKAKRPGRLPDGTAYTGRNRVMAIGDFLDEFPHESARFLKA